jgi:predicted O-methyltransferase YrrM
MKDAIKKISPIVDLIIFPLLLVSILIIKITRRLGIFRLSSSRFLYFKLGVFPVTNHYYDPFYSLNSLSKDRGERPLPGIDLKIDRQLVLLSQLSYSSELQGIPFSEINKSEFYWTNGSFESGDAEIWYNIIRSRKPSLIIEIGSGYSTLMAIEAINKNTIEDPDYLCEHICIEPYEMSWLEDKNVTVIRERVEDVNVDLFNRLGDDDILFIDSSHMIKRDGDVLHEYLHILPTLNKGVIVHVHDIFTPRDYPYEWISKYVRFWNEQYLFEAFLSCNSEWSTFLSLNYLKHNYYDELKSHCVQLKSDREPGSYYIQKQ